MKGFAVYYIEALIVCILLFLILLVHNHYNIDRQEKQIKLDRALIAFILYFITDCFWAAISDGMLPEKRALVVAIDLFLYVFMAAICYFWLEYVMAVEQAPNRNRPINRMAVLFPFFITTAALVINYIANPYMLVSESLEAQPAYSVYLLASPIVYLGAILFYTLKKAVTEKNPLQKRKHIFIGLFPFIAVIVGVLQEVFFPLLPVYCFVDSLLILVFYIQSIESRVSLDPLTNLNNRGELMRYVSQKSNIHQDNKHTIVSMMDINSFKLINDTYGHAEGDKALIIIANSLKAVIRCYSMPAFLGRYGGDEFILITHPDKETDVDQLMDEIRSRVKEEINRSDTQYALSLGFGYDELSEQDESIQDCIKRADKKLYQDKKRTSTP